LKNPVSNDNLAVTRAGTC